MSEKSYTLKNIPTENDHHRGSLDASIVIVEYADFECPFCAATSPVLDLLFQTYDDICIVYRHFPLKVNHSNAGVAAVAAEAAGEQNHFWEMHHALFENQHDLSTENIFSIARSLELDMRVFLNNVEDDDLLQRVRANYNQGLSDGVTTTPTLFVNGIRFVGLPTYGEMNKEIEEVLLDNQSFM